MTHLRDWESFLYEVGKGAYGDDKYLISKFGRNPLVGITLAPITQGGVWQTPTIAQALEVVSDSADDNAAGIGARSVQIEGIRYVGGVLVRTSETVIPNGLTPVPTPSSWLRIDRMFVKTSGTYATQTDSSHVGTLTLRGIGGGVLWAQIAVDAGFGKGQSQIGATTIPEGFEGTLINKSVTVEANKPMALFLYQRAGIDTIIAPFQPMLLKEQNDGLETAYQYQPKAPILHIPEKTDVGFMARAATGTVSCSIDFQILVERM